MGRQTLYDPDKGTTSYTGNQYDSPGSESNVAGDIVGGLKGSDLGGLVGGLIFRGKKKRLAKKAARIERKERNEIFQEGMTNSLQNEMDANRSYERGQHDLEGELGGRGLSDSSIAQDARRDAAFNQAERLNAIQRARVRLQHGYDAGEKLRDLQDKAAKIAEQEAMVAASVNAVVQVAGAVI